MNTEMGFELMEKMLPHMSAIISDDEVVDVKKLVRKDDTIRVGVAMDKILPLFLGKHREHMYAIAAIMADKTAEEVKQQPITDTINAIKDGVNSGIMDFFVCCLRMAMSA